MPTPATSPEPSRPTEIARLRLTRLGPRTPLKQAFAVACESAAKALGIERVGIWLFIENGKSLRCATLYERSKAEYSEGTILRIADFPAYFNSLTIRKAVPAEIAATDPRTAQLAEAYLHPLGITSLLDAGIFVDSKLVGVVCHEHVGPPREWTTEDRDFAGSVADLVALRIQSAEAHEQRDQFQTQRERLTALEKAAALEQMAAGVAHDFKNLLTVFMGYGELLSARDDLPADVKRQCEHIFVAAQRGTNLVEELRQFARPSDKPPAVLNLADETAEFLPVLQAAVGKQHAIDYSPPLALGHVLLGKAQYTRVLLNLAVNARDAMTEGGTIRIRVLPVKLNAETGPSGNFIMLEVTDTGQGMDEATQKRVFEPFFTTKSGGSGLGLAIVHQIVDRAGGFLGIESSPGAGATFRIFFPRVGAGTGGTMEYKFSPEFRRMMAESESADPAAQI